MAEDDFREFLDDINRAAAVIKYTGYAQVAFLLPLLIIDWITIFVIALAVFLLFKCKDISDMLVEFDKNMIKNQTYIAEASVDEALSCTNKIPIYSAVLFFASLALVKSCFDNNGWAIISGFSVIIYIFLIIFCNAFSKELRSLQFAISHYNDSKHN